MEAGAIQRYSNSIKSYADNIGGIRSALNEGVTLRQNNRLDAIANTQRQKLQNIFLSNIVNDEKLREIHESLSNLSIQAGAAPDALIKLNNAGVFNPVKRAGSALYSKIRTAGTSARLSGTAQPGDAVQMNTYDEDGLANDGSYKGPEVEDPETTYTPFEPNASQPTAQRSLRTTLTKAKEPPTATTEGSGQVGHMGQDFDEDVEDRFASLDRNIRPAGPPRALSSGAGSSTDPLPSTATATETADTAAEGADAAATAAETAGAETAGAEAGDTIASAAGTALAGAAEATGLGAALGTAAAIAGPASILAGLGFGIYELVQAFKPHPHPDMKKVSIPSQVKQTMNQIPTHRTLSVAPGANSAILQAGQSSAV